MSARAAVSNASARRLRLSALRDSATPSDPTAKLSNTVVTPTEIIRPSCTIAADTGSQSMLGRG